MKRERYRVWIQGMTRYGRRWVDPDYAAECLDCGEPWLTATAGSRKEAWDKCREHEKARHAALGVPQEGTRDE